MEEHTAVKDVAKAKLLNKRTELVGMGARAGVGWGPPPVPFPQQPLPMGSTWDVLSPHG
jgi:hypothetical protein